MTHDTSLLKTFYQKNSELHFELQVYDMFLSNGVEVDHGGRYLDIIDNKIREFDVIANLNTAMCQKLGLYCGIMLIECKNIKDDSPIIVGCRSRRPDEVYSIPVLRRELKIRSTIHNRHCTQYIDAMAVINNSTKSNIGVEILQVPNGKYESMMSRDDRRAIFEKWNQAVSHALSRSVDRIKSMEYQGACGDLHIGIFPVLVVPNGVLYMSDSNSGEISSINAINVKFGQTVKIDGIGGEALAIKEFTIITFSGMAGLLKELNFA